MIYLFIIISYYYLVFNTMELDLRSAYYYIAKAQKELKSLSLFSNKYENAIKYYEKARLVYQLDKEWEKCVDMIFKILECYQHTSFYNDIDIADCYVGIANCYNNIKNYEEYIRYLEISNKIYLENNYLSKVSKNYNLIAQSYETNNNIKKAINYYEKQLWIEQSNLTNNTNTSTINNINLKLGELHIQNKNYSQTIEYFNTVLKYYSTHDLFSKYKVDSLLLTIMLAYICNDDNVLTSKMLDDYIKNYNDFMKSKEYKLLINIINAFNDNNIEDFNKSLKFILSLTNIQKHLLKVIENIILANANEELDFR